MKDWVLIIQDYHVTIHVYDSAGLSRLYEEVKGIFKVSEIDQITIRAGRLELSPGWFVEDLRTLMEDVISVTKNTLGPNGRVLVSIQLQEREIDSPFTRDDFGPTMSVSVAGDDGGGYFVPAAF